MEPIDARTDAAEARWRAGWATGPTRLRWTAQPVQVGDQAPDASLPDHEGWSTTLSGRWRERPLLVLFWRHFGCSCGMDRAARLPDRAGRRSGGGGRRHHHRPGRTGVAPRDTGTASTSRFRSCPISTGPSTPPTACFKGRRPRSCLTPRTPCFAARHTPRPWRLPGPAPIAPWSTIRGSCRASS